MATIQKKHYQKIFWAFLCATIFTFVFTNHSISAANPTGPAYYIQVLPTENQLNQNNAYFELNVGEHFAQKIQVKVFNQSKQPLTLQQIITAYTTNSGNIGYEPTEKPITFDKTLRFKLTDFVTLLSPEKFTIKPNSSAVVTAQIKSDLPKEFNGEVLGSWYFVQKTNGTHKIQQGVAIKNNYAYVTSIGLQKGPKVLGDLKLPKAQATVNNNVLGVGVTLQNPNPGILGNLTTATKIYRLKGNKQILATVGTNQAMAPNSNFEEFIPAGKQNLTPGKYRAVVDGISGMQKWHLTRDFEITATDTKKLNQQIVVYKKPLPWAWIIISSILVLVILVLLWVIFKRRRKDDNDGISES